MPTVPRYLGLAGCRVRAWGYVTRIKEEAEENQKNAGCVLAGSTSP
jgi:hypothetical protein